MNERANQPPPAAAVGAGAGPALSPAFAPFEKYGPLDPQWIECVVDGFKTSREGKAAFRVHERMTDFIREIPDQVTIAIVGDWGAPNDAAKRVAKQIAARKPDILIHLGDIYYAGQEDEVMEALALWPIQKQGGKIPAGTSYSLNGNHEMYSGGKAYFQIVLPALGQEASYFGLRNKQWQLLAFDTAYVDHRLLSPEDAQGNDAALEKQWNWLVDKMQSANLATILLCHHQPVSAFQAENTNAEKLRADFEKFRKAAGRDPFGWFFGHEHKCTIYDDVNIPYLARLVGHGCIPHTPPPKNQKPEPGCFSFSRMNPRTNVEGDAVSGFALLKFDGRQIDITYIDEGGETFFHEIWDAPV